MAKGQITERTFRLVTAGYIKYLEYYCENKADIGVNFLIIIVDRYKTLDHLLSARLKGLICSLGLPVRCPLPLNRGARLIEVILLLFYKRNDWDLNLVSA